MLFLEAHVQVQALDKSLHLKQPLKAEVWSRQNFLETR